MNVSKKPVIVTFAGLAEAGKSSAAKILQQFLELQEKKSMLAANGDYLKFICRQYFGWDGNKDEEGRTILQQVGTEKVRAKDETFWVDSLIRLVDVIGDEYDYVLIDDARFPNELSQWQKAGYKVVAAHINRPDHDNVLTSEQKQHASEVALDGYEFDVYLSAIDLDGLSLEIVEKIWPMISEG